MFSYPKMFKQSMLHSIATCARPQRGASCRLGSRPAARFTLLATHYEPRRTQYVGEMALPIGSTQLLDDRAIGDHLANCTPGVPQGIVLDRRAVRQPAINSWGEALRHGFGGRPSPPSAVSHRAITTLRWDEASGFLAPGPRFIWGLYPRWSDFSLFGGGPMA